MKQFKVSVDVMKPEPSQLRKWRWAVLENGDYLMTYWGGGETVDCYGPFTKDEAEKTEEQKS